MTGTLYIVGTPIGNLEDMTPRALRILGEVSLIAAEDTRRTGKLLNHFGIKTPMLSYHKFNEKERAPEIIARLSAGENLALVSDAGLPGISDPGGHLIKAAIEAGLPLVPVPGPAACLLALAASGLPMDSFVFLGFLPRRGKERQQVLNQLVYEPRTAVLYEAPHRLVATLSDLSKVLGGQRQVVVAREMTKIHEEFQRGDLSQALAYFSGTPVKGEITLVLAGYQHKKKEPSLDEARRRVNALMEEGYGLSQAVRAAALETGVTKNRLYQEFVARVKEP